jgi:hypothetical protein
MINLCNKFVTLKRIRVSKWSRCLCFEMKGYSKRTEKQRMKEGHIYDGNESFPPKWVDLFTKPLSRSQLSLEEELIFEEAESFLINIKRAISFRTDSILAVNTEPEAENPRSGEFESMQVFSLYFGRIPRELKSEINVELNEMREVLNSNLRHSFGLLCVNPHESLYELFKHIFSFLARFNYSCQHIPYHQFFINYLDYLIKKNDLVLLNQSLTYMVASLYKPVHIPLLINKLKQSIKIVLFNLGDDQNYPTQNFIHILKLNYLFLELTKNEIIHLFYETFRMTGFSIGQFCFFTSILPKFQFIPDNVISILTEQMNSLVLSNQLNLVIYEPFSLFISEMKNQRKNNLNSVENVALFEKAEEVLNLTTDTMKRLVDKKISECSDISIISQYICLIDFLQGVRYNVFLSKKKKYNIVMNYKQLLLNYLQISNVYLSKVISTLRSFETQDCVFSEIWEKIFEKFLGKDPVLTYEVAREFNFNHINNYVTQQEDIGYKFGLVLVEKLKKEKIIVKKQQFRRLKLFSRILSMQKELYDEVSISLCDFFETLVLDPINPFLEEVTVQHPYILFYIENLGKRGYGSKQYYYLINQYFLRVLPEISAVHFSYLFYTLASVGRLEEEVFQKSLEFIRKSIEYFGLAQDYFHILYSFALLQKYDIPIAKTFSQKLADFYHLLTLQEKNDRKLNHIGILVTYIKHDGPKELVDSPEFSNLKKCLENEIIKSDIMISSNEKEICKFLFKMNIVHMSNYLLSQLPHCFADVYIPLKTVIEVEGPHHFLYNSKKYKPSTKIKQR